ncbi:HAMP domain-containing protein [uncultured Arthrobacter sp.]|uniref:HAMP domain-containing protein n=1 Tax=uncultured Arthrobacter sp. TaxID=114050 RepID=UPI0032180EA7
MTSLPSTSTTDIQPIGRSALPVQLTMALLLAALADWLFYGQRLGFSLAIVVIIARGIGSQVSTLTDLVKQIELGNVEARAEVLSQDELGALALSFNTTLDNTSGLLQSREERDAIQRSIMRLLEEVSTVAEGDLTRQAAVTEDITGAIADSFNFMIAELRRIIGDAGFLRGTTVSPEELEAQRAARELLGPQ